MCIRDRYTVPEGQPPVLGADASIPDNAYQNYRYGDIRKAPDFEIQEVLKLRYKEIDELVRNREISVEDAEALKKVNVKYMDLTSHDSTVILLHEDGFNAKMTAPIRAVAGIFTPLKSDGITSFAVDLSLIHILYRLTYIKLGYAISRMSAVRLKIKSIKNMIRESQ